MSTYNIREKFSYTIATSSIDYIRNYNFNSATVSDIPLSMSNADTTIPITVNMTTTVPWIQIVDPTTGASLKYPDGNVVLEPTSSKIVFVKIDLPPEIENIPESVIYPSINVEIKSGSFLIITPTTTGSQSEAKKNAIATAPSSVSMIVGERVQIDITVYDVDGNVDSNPEVIWESDNMSIVQIEQSTEIGINYTPKIIRGISPGQATISVTSGPRSTTIPVTVSSTQNTFTNSSTTSDTDQVQL